MNVDRCVRERERRAITGVAPVTWWRWERAGLVPRRVRLGPKAVGWKMSQLQEWLQSRESA